MKELYISGIVNVQELGKHSLETFTRDRLLKDSEISLWSTVGRNKFSNFHAAMNHKPGKKEKENVKFERNLLAKFVIASRSLKSVDEQEVIGTYELRSYPPSLMQHRTLHECKTKYEKN